MATYKRKPRKQCLDCPAEINLGKRCGPCSDAYKHQKDLARGKLRWARQVAANGSLALKQALAEVDRLAAQVEARDLFIRREGLWQKFSAQRSGNSVVQASAPAASDGGV